MFAFLRRLAGTSEEYKAAEERYKKQLEELAEREKELEALGEQLHEVSELQKEKCESLSKTSTDLTATLSRSITPPDMKAVKEDEQDEEDRHSGDAVPAVG
jgi:DNA repair ATPase RecN